MISDKELDLYNRLLMFYLYDNVCYYQDNSADKVAYQESRNESIKLLPFILRKNLRKEE